MTTKPIYVSTEHEILIESYLNTLYSNLQEISPEDKYDDFVYMSDNIIDYHNFYSESKETGNWNDFLMIIPLHLACMVNGFLLGIETDDNRNDVRIYRELLGQFNIKIIKDLSTIEPIHE